MDSQAPAVDRPSFREFCRAWLANSAFTRATCRLVLASALGFASVTSAVAGTFAVFGPQTYVRSTGAPVLVHAAFTVLNPRAPYSIRITSDGVASAEIALNGVVVVGPSDFNRNVTTLERGLSVQSVNDIAVELRGAPGTTLMILIVGVDNDPPVIMASATPVSNPSGWNNTDVKVIFTCNDAISGIASCPAPVTASTEGRNQVVSGTAVDNAGNSATASVTLNIDKTPPSVTVVSPQDGAIVSGTSVPVTAMVTDVLSGVANVTCKGVPAPFMSGTVNCDVPLTPGANSISIAAVDIAGNSKTLNLTVFLPPTITITAPVNLSFINNHPITVSGTVSDPNATITVNGIAAPSGGGAFSVTLPLIEGNNTITVVASVNGRPLSTASIQVTLDTTPPRVTILTPPNGFVTTDSKITVSGSANDTVVGTVNDQQMQVTVNGQDALVRNRSFQAFDVDLTLGDNVITATARDRAGNGATTTVSVRRDNATQPHVQLVSGNNQSGSVGSQLPAALVVALLDASGNPVPNQTVVFAVTQNNGILDGGRATSAASTDAQGHAQTHWALGMRSGAGNNTVIATANGFAGSALFTASGTAAAAALINMDAGSDQNGVAGQPLPHPFVAVVQDSGHNRLPNIPVTFNVKQGGGSFNGQSTVTTMSDSDGRALGTLTLGPSDGIANNIVEATFPGNTGFPAAFVASGRATGDPAATRITGVVLDNSNAPVAGVTIRAYLTNVPAQVSQGIPPSISVQTDPQGQFLIQPAPVGFVKLIADGGTAQRPGQWPNLEYDLVTVPGQNNTIGMPIYLLPLDTADQLCLSATSGGTLTLPQFPGFSLTVQPGAATFPGGSKSGCISVTPVHPDKIPMVPGFGQQPRFIVTIQPAGTLFNPPAQISIPNAEGLKPLEVTEMYSFDHDLGTFVSIGTGTVSANGTIIASDPGIGVLKAGWFCGGNSSPTGSAGTCAVCQRCVGSLCVADNAQDGLVCTQPPQIPGVCQNGTCARLGGLALVASGISPIDSTEAFFEYQVLDQFGAALAVSGLVPFENVPANTVTLTPLNGPAVVFTQPPASGQCCAATDSRGHFIDNPIGASTQLLFSLQRQYGDFTLRSQITHQYSMLGLTLATFAQSICQTATTDSTGTLSFGNCGVTEVP